MSAIRIGERFLLAAAMLAMSLLFFINVLAREFSPKLAVELAWIEESSLFVLAWMVFVGLGLVLERRRHIAMTAWSDAMPERPARALRLTINLCGVVFGVLMAKFSFDFALFTWRSGQISPTLGFSMVALYAPLPLGFALLTLRYLLELFGAQDRFAIKDVFTDH